MFLILTNTVFIGILTRVCGYVSRFLFLWVMKKILLTSHHNEEEADRFFGFPSLVVHDYKVYPFYKEGALTVIVPALQFSKEELREMVRMVDMVVFTGGDDINTKHYGEEGKYSTLKHYQYRDEIEFGLLEAAVAERKSVFGICRGLQIINVFFGGTLYQNLHHDYEGEGILLHREDDSEKQKLSHEIIIEPHSFLSRVYSDNQKLFVNSLHNQSVKKLGERLVVSARSTDGIIEALEHTEYPIYGVQWHPEYSYKIDSNSQLLIRAMVNM